MPLYYPKARVDLALWGARTTALAPADLVVSGLVPADCEVAITPYGEADTCHIALPFDDFPIDTRVLRDVLVTVRLGDTSSVDDELSATDRPMFVGFVDEPPVTMGRDGDAVALRARDYAGLALDEPWGTVKVRIDRRLDAVVRDVLGHYPRLSALVRSVRVDVGKVNTSVPMVSEGTRRGREYRARRDGNVWEALGELAARVGWVVRMHGDEVILSPADGVYRQALYDTPRFVMGETLESLTLTRKLTRERVEGVRVIAYNSRDGRTLTALFPRGLRDYRDYFAPRGPAWTQATVEGFAERLHGLLSRHQATVSFDTREMRAGAHRLTSLRNGSVVRIAVDPELETAVALSEGRRTGALVAAGVDADVARVLTENFQDLLTPWIVERATHRWSPTDGYRLSVTGVNVAVDLED